MPPQVQLMKKEAFGSFSHKSTRMEHSYGSRQLVKHEKNTCLKCKLKYGEWTFMPNTSKGKFYSLYRPQTIEKFGPSPQESTQQTSNCNNWIWLINQVQIGINMQADYLIRYSIAALNEMTPQVDLFTPNLQAFQSKDSDIFKVQYYLQNQKWSLNTTKPKSKGLPITSNFNSHYHLSCLKTTQN